MPGESFVLVLFSAHSLVLEEVGVCAGELLHQRGLLVVCLEDAVLVWAELLEFGFEECCFLACDGFFVEDEDVADVVVVYLDKSAIGVSSS